MIRINLLPHDMRPIKRTALPHALSLCVLVAAVALMVVIFVGEHRVLTGLTAQHQEKRAELNKLAGVVEEHNRLTQTKLDLQEKILTIQDILKERTLWSEWFHELMRLTPDNIWYSRIRLTTRKFPEEKIKLNKKGEPEIDPKTKKPVMTKTQVDRPILEVTGYAIEDESGLSSTSTLANNTNTDAKFASRFSLFTSKIEDTDFNGYAVRKFTFEYLI